MSYVLIPRIEIFGANAQSAYPIVTGPSPLAFLGFARCMALDLGGEQSEKIQVAILHHDIEMRGEGDKYGSYRPSQFRGAALTVNSKAGASSDYVVGGLSMSLQPVALCNLTVSLIISGLDGFSESEIQEQVLVMRIAGGHIRQTGRVKRFETIDAAAKRAGSGYFVTERRDILNVPADEKIKAMLLAMTQRKEGDGWILPMNLGFLPVTPFTEKLASRKGLKHAYAEPLIGLVQYKTRRALADEKQNIPVWRYSTSGDALFATNCN